MHQELCNLHLESISREGLRWTCKKEAGDTQESKIHDIVVACRTDTKALDKGTQNVVGTEQGYGRLGKPKQVDRASASQRGVVIALDY